jgi:hypothetical protein
MQIAQTQSAYSKKPKLQNQQKIKLSKKIKCHEILPTDSQEESDSGECRR